MSEDIKKDARKIAMQVRSRLHAENKVGAFKSLINIGFPISNSGDKNIISGYLSYRGEIDVTGLMQQLSDQGWKTCLPVVKADGEPLVFRSWSPGQETIAGRWGIAVPPASVKTVEPDVLLVPLLSFDRSGFRLGYGGGFYDRTIEFLKTRKKIITMGVAYAGQEVDKVPHENHDQPLDMVITEKGIVECV